MSDRRRSVSVAWSDLLAALERYIREGSRLARCRLRGGHQRGTWRLNDGRPNPSGIAEDAGPDGFDYAHTWCRRCGWCEQTQSFAEEDEWQRDPSGSEPVPLPF